MTSNTYDIHIHFSGTPESARHVSNAQIVSYFLGIISVPRKRSDQSPSLTHNIITWSNRYRAYIHFSRLPESGQKLFPGNNWLFGRLQDAQLSQRDRAAGCVIAFAKSRTLELGDNDLRTL